MPQTVDQFAARAATLPGRLVDATPRAVRASGAVLELAVRSNVARATGGDMRLSRVRSGKGATIAIRLRVDGAGRSATAHVVPTGPIMLVEDDTKRHRSPRRSLAERTGGRRSYDMSRRRKAQRRGFLFIPGVGIRQYADHPGTRGKRPVRRAFQQSHDEAGRAGVLVFATTARNYLGGRA